jgi:hypothetical protein
MEDVRATRAWDKKRVAAFVLLELVGDTLWFAVPIKGMIQNGWTYEIRGCVLKTCRASLTNASVLLAESRS